MAFGATAAPRPATKSENKESAYLRLEENKETVVRILSKQEVSYWYYWMPVMVNGERKNRSIVVEYDNPIKAQMDKLDPKSKEFQKVSRKFVINVLDRTDDANRVCMFNFGVTLLRSLVALDGKARKRSDFTKRLSITEFDLLLDVSLDAKGNKVINPLQHFDDEPLSDALQALPVYDLEKIYAPLPNEAVERILKGEDYLQVLESIGRSGNYPMIPQTQVQE